MSTLFNYTEKLVSFTCFAFPVRQTLQMSPEIYPFISLTQCILCVSALIHKSWRLCSAGCISSFICFRPKDLIPLNSAVFMLYVQSLSELFWSILFDFSLSLSLFMLFPFHLSSFGSWYVDGCWRPCCECRIRLKWEERQHPFWKRQFSIWTRISHIDIYIYSS